MKKLVWNWRNEMTKIRTEQEMNMDVGVKQVQRVVSKMNQTNSEAGYFSGADVDAYLTSFLADGWRLLNTHYLGENPEGYILWYVLVKQ